MAANVTPPINEALVHARLGDVERGSKGVLIDELCAATGRSRSTVYRLLRETTLRPQRRQRSDAGEVALTRDEAKLICAMVMEGMRKNGIVSSRLLLCVMQILFTLEKCKRWHLSRFRGGIYRAAL